MGQGGEGPWLEAQAPKELGLPLVPVPPDCQAVGLAGFPQEAEIAAWGFASDADLRSYRPQGFAVAAWHWLEALQDSLYGLRFRIQPGQGPAFRSTGWVDI